MYRKCFLCERSETSANRLEVHHLFGGANRKLSEKYSLTVTLCHACHNEPGGAHYDSSIALFLHQYGQRKAMQENNWDEQTFREIFGKNYL